MKISGYINLARRAGQSKLAGSAGIYLLGTLFNRVFPLTMIPIYTRVLSPHEFGIYGFSMMLLNALLVLTDLGLTGASMRFYYDIEDPKAMKVFLITGLVTRCAVALGICLLTAGLGWIFWGEIGDGGYDFASIVPITLASAAVAVLPQFALTLDRVAGRPKQFIRTQILLTGAQSVLSLAALFWLDQGPIAPMMGYFAGALLIGLWESAKIVRRAWGVRPNLHQAWESIAYGAAATPIRMATWVKNLSDRAVISASRSATELGIYQLSSSAISPFYLVSQSVNQAYMPFYFEKRKKGVQALPFIVALDCIYIGGLAIVSLGVLCFAAEFVRIMAPPSYYAATRIAPLLIGGAYLAAVSLQFTKELYYHKKPGLVSAASAPPAILGLLMNVWLVPKYGAIAAGAVSLGVNAVTQVLAIVITGRIEKTGHPALRFWLVHGVVCAVAIWLAFSFMALPFAIGNMLIRAAVFAGASALIAALLIVPGVIGVQRRWEK